MICESARAEYAALLVHDGKSEATLTRGQKLDLMVELLSSRNEQHNAAILRFVFSAPGLTYHSYSWLKPYQNGTDDDDSKPLQGRLPAMLAVETLGGIGYPAGEVDLELSNVVPARSVPQYFSSGTLVRVVIEVPSNYAGPDVIQIRLVPDTFARGATVIPVIATQPFTLKIAVFPVQQPEADSDGDGISNLMEYALNLNPDVPDAPPMTRSTPGLPVFGVEKHDSQTVFGFTFRSYPDKKDIIYKVQVSDDLKTWTDVPDALVETVGDAQIRKVELPLSERLKFMRLKIVRAP